MTTPAAASRIAGTYSAPRQPRCCAAWLAMKYVEPQRDLIAGADDADGVAAALDGNPVGATRTQGVQPSDWQKPLVAHTNSRNQKPALRPNSTLSAAEPNMPIASMTRGENPLGQLAVEQLPEAIGDFERRQDPADLCRRKEPGRRPPAALSSPLPPTRCSCGRNRRPRRSATTSRRPRSRRAAAGSATMAQAAARRPRPASR